MPKNTGHGSRREGEGRSIGVFAAAKARGGSLTGFTPTPEARAETEGGGRG